MRGTGMFDEGQGRSARIVCAVLIFSGLLSGLEAFAAGESSSVNGAAILPSDIDFNRHIRPILAENCLTCHGPDEGARKAELRLDVREAAVAARENGQAIVPGQPDASQLILRITHHDPDERMPPPKTEKQLSIQEIELLKAWIADGAEYAPHWSFIPPKRPDLPDVKRKDWPRNGLDHFVLARLETEGLAPNPEAPRETLIRRVSLDLTGLPPTPDEVAAFVNDQSPDAYAKVVNRVLESPHYGERMALPWLDAARYADSHGYQRDDYRTMWPWRDWVVKAFNRNLPFDQFTIEQLAGDMLPDATLEQRLASGFNRNHRINQEGGSIDEEWRVEYVADRVETTSTVWLGLTMGCARCHDHKYDPFAQKEFYRMFAFFNSVTEEGKIANRAPLAPPPIIEIIDPKLKLRLEEVRKVIETLTSQLKPTTPKQREAYVKWQEEARAQLGNQPQPEFDPWHVIGPFKAKNFDQAHDKKFPPEKAVRLNRKYNEGKLKWVARPEWKDGKVHQLKGENSATYLFRTVRVKDPTRINLSLGSDDSIRVWVNAEEVLNKKVKRGVKPDQEKVAVNLKAGKNTLLLKITNGTGGYGFYFKPLGVGPPKKIADILRKIAEKRSAEQTRKIEEYYGTVASELADVRKDRALQREERKKLEAAAITKVMVMQEMKDPRDTYLLVRGQYDQPDESEKLAPSIPAVFGKLPEGLPNNRLGLAKWLVHPENPLTARVIANRYWQKYFGAGLVKTVEDFGTRGELPSHPDLLDWLATEFMRLRWDIKAMQRLIVSSATYRQSSRVRAELLARDPENRLLARGPRFRLTGAFIRDSALAVSGLLVRTLGGPPVRPYQPPGLWSDLSFNEKKKNPLDFYVEDKGDKLYRRSLYTIWKRSVPPPSMSLFDAGGREICNVILQVTNTPLQALNLMNDTVYVEASRFMAERMMREGGGTVDERLRFGWRLVLARQPGDAELAVLRRSLDLHLNTYRDHPENATLLLSVGEKPRDENLNPAEHAAYTLVASLILNLDEAVTKE